MMDFLMEQSLLYSSEKFEEIYGHFNTKYEMKYHELFIICASLGFKNNRKSEVENRGKVFRSNYFTSSQKATVYSIILSDPELGKNLELFDDKEFRLKARRLLESYAEGGMEILVEEVFSNQWDGNKLDAYYTEYEIDLLGYIYADASVVPF